MFLEGQTRSNLGSSGDSEKTIQRLNDELHGAREMANTEKHKCMELQGNVKYHYINASNLFILHKWKLCTNNITCNFAFLDILDKERKEKRQQADESAKQIQVLQGIAIFCLEAVVVYNALL